MVAPEGWEIVELISLSDGGMQNGLFYNNERKFRGIPIINVGDMYNQVPIVSKRLALFNATHTEIKSFAVNDGDLFFTRSSVVPDGIAFCNWYKQTSKIPVVFDSHVIRFRTNKNKVLPMFLYLQCISRYARMFFLSNAKTAAMTTIDQTVIGKCSILLPPLPEQRRIAEVLSDMDAELSVLKKKLEKIRLIKQGMMDALLTGKIRLPEDKPNVQFTQRKEQEEILYAAEKTEEYTANHKKRNKHIDDAVMIAGIVNELYSQKYPLGRKKVQKCLYLLRRHQKRSTTEFKKKAAGPYADEIRYRGGEPIALSAQYIITQKGTKGTLFFKGTNIQQALNYIEQWNMQTDIQWLRERLKFKSVDTLELWATVDMAICDLENMQMPISLSSIKHLIATNAEWKKKLEKPLFNDANIIKAISELRTLFEYKSK